MSTPSDMLLFVAVAREGSFTRAASQFGITKQSASERVAKLEARLGVRLLERTTRALRLTDAGATYYERASAIVAQIEEAERETRELQVEPAGLLRVSAPALYGRRFLGPVIAAFLGRHPKVRVELVLANRRVNLIEEGFDLAIRIGALDDASLTARKLGGGYVYFVASPTFIATHRPRRTNLRTLPCVGLSASERWTIGGVAAKVAPVLVVNDLEMVCDAAIAGVGAARLPSLVCRDAVRDGRLRVLFARDSATESPVYAVYPSRRHLAPKVRLFVDALAAMVAPMRPLDIDARRRQKDGDEA